MIGRYRVLMGRCTGRRIQLAELVLIPTTHITLTVGDLSQPSHKGEQL